MQAPGKAGRCIRPPLMYLAAAALWEQITAFPEKVLQTEMAPRRLISTQNEELMH